MVRIIQNGKCKVQRCPVCDCLFSYEKSDVSNLGEVECPHCKLPVAVNSNNIVFGTYDKEE